MSDPGRPATPSRRAQLILAAVCLCLWLGSWGLLTGAAAVAGAHPTVAPLEFLNPLRLVDTYHGDGGHLVWWHLVGAGAPPHPWLFFGFVIIAPLCCAAALLAGVIAWNGGLPGFAAARLLLPSRLPRSSRWAGWRDLRSLRVRRSRTGAMILGRRGPSLIATERETSVLVVGPTRSGKTSGLVVPNLLEWRGAAVVTSTKSELVDLTAAHRHRNGPVFVYDPTGDLGNSYRTTTWSPLAGCATLDAAWRTAAWLCAGLQQGGGRADNDWAHWAESGKLLIAPLLYAAAVSCRTIVDVGAWISSFELDEPRVILEVMGHTATTAEPAGRALLMLQSIDQRPEKERGTVFSTVMRIFSVFNEQPVARSSESSEFDATRLLREGGTLYLCTPRQSPERVASLFVGILMTVVTEAYTLAAAAPRGRLAPELGLFLDELANVVPIEDLPALASQGAGRGVVLMSIIQDFSQLRSRYGSDRANSILNNHGCKMVLPGIGDPETAEVVARMVGRTEYTDLQLSHQGGNVSRSYSLRQEQMASPDALRQLQEGTAIVLYRGKPPTIVRLRPWFADRRLTAMVQPAGSAVAVGADRGLSQRARIRPEQPSHRPWH